MIAEVPNYIVSALSFIGFVLVMIPFPWHWKTSNRGTCMYMVWTALGCFNQFINSAVWNKNTVNNAPVWCDISTRITIGLSIAIPAASLCIMRHLHQITCLQSIHLSKKRRSAIIDVAIGIGLPLLGIIFYYFVEGHRFDILEDIGCYPAVYGTPLAFVLLLCWPPAIGVVCGVYGCLIICACIKRYTDIRASVASLPHSFRHYYRLCALSLISSVCTIAGTSYLIVANVLEGGTEPWKGWADDHYAFSAVWQFPAVEWRNLPNAATVQISRFILICCPLLFFSFFGLTEEVRKLYRNAFVTLVTKFSKMTAQIHAACSSRRKRQFDTSLCQERGNPTVTLPVSTQHKLAFRHDLMASFSPNFSLSNIAFGTSDFVITLADKQASDSSIEFSSQIGTLPHTPSSDQSLPNSPIMPPARPELAHVDVRDSKGSRTLDEFPSDNIV